MSNHKSETESFWAWFEGIASSLSESFEREKLLAELDARASRLGDVTWEIGPGSDGSDVFVVSPDGNKDLLERTRSIVESAPKIPGWELCFSRPPRDWDLRFSIEGSSGEAISVDAREWCYVLYKFPDETFDIVVEQSNLETADEDARDRAATILLDGQIGEAMRIELIRGIEAVVVLNDSDRQKASPVRTLTDHLSSLLTAH